MIAVPEGSVVFLSGAGLSAASGIQTFRGAGGLWEGYDVSEVATPEAWSANPALVRRFYDERRVAAVNVQPNEGHRALARLQAAWGPERVRLVTQNIDGLLQRAGAVDVVEMHGSLHTLRCEAHPEHPRIGIEGHHDPGARCLRCGAPMRPAIVWFGEIPEHMDRIYTDLFQSDLFVSVGTSGVVYPAAGFVRIALQAGARAAEINPEPSGGPFHHVVAEGSETALPRLVDTWLG